MTNPIVIETPLEIIHEDSGLWRSYELQTRGATLTDLMINATISEIDQDGGELNTYSLVDASNPVFAKAQDVISEIWQAAKKKQEIE